MLWTDLRQLENAVRNYDTVFSQLPHRIDKFQTLEKIFVLHLEPSGGGINRGHADVLLHLLDLPQRGARSAVRQHQPIHQKVADIILVALLFRVDRHRAKVAAIGEVFPTLLGLVDNGLIGPVPDEPPLQRGDFFDNVPNIGKITDTVAHGMGILVKDIRTGDELLVREKLIPLRGLETFRPGIRPLQLVRFYIS